MYVNPIDLSLLEIIEYFFGFAFLCVVIFFEVLFFPTYSWIGWIFLLLLLSYCAYYRPKWYLKCMQKVFFYTWIIFKYSEFKKRTGFYWSSSRIRPRAIGGYEKLQLKTDTLDVVEIRYPEEDYFTGKIDFDDFFTLFRININTKEVLYYHPSLCYTVPEGKLKERILDRVAFLYMCDGILLK